MRQFQRRPYFFDAQLFAIEPAQHTRHRSMRRFVAKGKGQQDIAIGQHHALAAVVGVNERAARIVPFQDAPLGPSAIRPSHGVHRITRQLIAAREFWALVKNNVAHR
ncbi:MAG TPA: hypothetical protein EYQ62_04790 [Verrucomicrobiales bacterium]|nr:hypothetical protein [Verrucomicrobiales bacterium]